MNLRTYKFSRSLAVVAALFLLTLSLAACNTTKGVGKDIQKAGTGLENSAEKHGAD